MPLQPISPITNIEFKLDTIEVLKVGMIVLLRAFTTPSAAAITFQSSDNTVIRILPDESNPCTEYGSCLLEVVGEGTAVIAAKSGELRKYLSIKTYQSDYDENQNEGDKMIELNTDYLRICLGETFQLQAVTNPPHQPVKWRSRNYQIANVEDGGFVTGCSRGIVEVVASYNSATAVCTVEVVDLGIDGDHFRIGIGEKFRIPVGIYPSTYKIIWNSSDNSIAPIDWKGIVTGLKKGSVQIVAVVDTDTGAISKVCTVDVCDYFEPWTYFDKTRLKELKIYDKYYELIQDNAGSEIRKVESCNGMPTLYYVRIDKHPFLYNYKVVAVDNDIQKFLLGQ